MKFIHIIISVLITFQTFAQDNYINSNNLKRGVYKTYTDFRNNTPLNIQFRVEKTNSNYGDFKIKKTPVFLLKAIVSPSDSLYMIYGFCDGQSVYLNDNAIIKPFNAGNEYFKMEYIGNICIIQKFHNEIKQYTQANGMPGGKKKVKKLKSFLMYLESGIHHEITNKNIIKLLKNDEELYKQYKGENNKNNIEVLKLYIIYYSERNKPVYRKEKETISIKYGSLGRRKFHINNVAFKNTDSTFNKYYKRILRWKTASGFNDVKIIEKNYSDGKTKIIGLEAKHTLESNGNFYYKIGTWKTYFNNGILKSEIDYNLLGVLNGKYTIYDNNGKLIKNKEYKNGKLIK